MEAIFITLFNISSADAANIAPPILEGTHLIDKNYSCFAFWKLWPSTLSYLLCGTSLLKPLGSLPTTLGSGFWTLPNFPYTKPKSTVPAIPSTRLAT
jgi:hypothetical protein